MKAPAEPETIGNRSQTFDCLLLTSRFPNHSGSSPRAKKMAQDPGKGSDQQQLFLMQMRNSKADQTVEGIRIILSSISKGATFLHQSVST